ncbi:MAG: hypothetical protein COA33_004325 [Fluviicola sp.]|nr:hypothetical protein [Fluviicola sp.]
MKYIFYSFFILLLFSCSEGEEKTLRLTKKKYQPFIINLAQTFSENETNMSFPTWFADSLIKENKVRKITHYIYPHTSNTSEESIPKESKIYSFNEEGEVQKVEIAQFYEYITVGSLVFDYSAKKDQYGYSPVSFKRQDKDMDSDFEEQYAIYKKVEYSEKFLVYQNEESGDYLFYMLHRKNWGALSVDSILSPTPSDRIIFGSPKKRVKSYQVENTVNEFNAIEYSYDKSKRYPVEITSEHFPFRTKRTIEYDENGLCSGFIDSTFSGTKYLTRRHSQFVYQDGLPVKLVHESKSNNAEQGFIQIEEFEYYY